MSNNNTPKFCPHCGHPIKPGYAHCPNCGYDLVNQPTISNQSPRQFNPQPQEIQHDMRRLQSKPKRSGHILMVIIIVLILIICGGGSYYYYKTNVATPQIATPHSSHNSYSHSNSSNNNSKNKVTSRINSMWNCIEDIATNNESSQNLADYFDGGSSNKDYHIINGWSKDMSKADNLKDLKVTPHVKSIKADGNTVKVAYQVNYVFHYADDTKRQGFIWHAKMTKVNGNWKLLTNKADNSHPVYND